MWLGEYEFDFLQSNWPHFSGSGGVEGSDNSMSKLSSLILSWSTLLPTLLCLTRYLCLLRYWWAVHKFSLGQNASVKRCVSRDQERVIDYTSKPGKPSLFWWTKVVQTRVLVSTGIGGSTPKTWNPKMISFSNFWYLEALFCLLLSFL